MPKLGSFLLRLLLVWPPDLVFWNAFPYANPVFVFEMTVSQKMVWSPYSPIAEEELSVWLVETKFHPFSFLLSD